MSFNVILDSVNPITNDRIITVEFEYQRFIHAEMLRHRVFSSSVSSSRAVPLKRVLEQIRNNPAKPIYWGSNKPGMVAGDETNELVTVDLRTVLWDPSAIYTLTREETWELHRLITEQFIIGYDNAGYHKQIPSRLIEPHQNIKHLVTSTEWQNFINLRCHSDAQPEIQKVACEFAEYYNDTKPIDSFQHFPFISEDNKNLSFKEKIMIGVSCAAQTSYRKANDSLEKAENLFNKLMQEHHWSPFEHVAIGGIKMKYDNFTGWKSVRYLINNELHNAETLLGINLENE